MMKAVGKYYLAHFTSLVCQPLDWLVDLRLAEVSTIPLPASALPLTVGGGGPGFTADEDSRSLFEPAMLAAFYALQGAALFLADLSHGLIDHTAAYRTLPGGVARCKSTTTSATGPTDRFGPALKSRSSPGAAIAGVLPANPVETQGDCGRPAEQPSDPLARKNTPHIAAMACRIAFSISSSLLCLAMRVSILSSEKSLTFGSFRRSSNNAASPGNVGLPSLRCLILSKNVRGISFQCKCSTANSWIEDRTGRRRTPIQRSPPLPPPFS